MNSTGRQILKSIIQGKWLSIEYRNKKTMITRYWVNVVSINPVSQTLEVSGFNIAYDPKPINLKIYFQSILHADIIDGTYAKKNDKLINDITVYPDKYEFIFNNQPNFRIIDYLVECNELDNAPYRTNYILVRLIDEDTIMKNREYHLSEAQFQTIVSSFQKQLDLQNQNSFRTKIGMNILSINTKKGLYILAYKKLLLDIENRVLTADKETVINREFTIDGNTLSILRYLPEEDQYLLEDFEINRKSIIDIISSYIGNPEDIDTSPFIVEVQYNSIVDLHHELNGLINMYDENRVTIPVKAFFGELKSPSRRTKNYPITLIDNKINLDQLLTIHKAMKQPLAYVQGPPGTGKTNTIINVIISAFFNEKTVLVTSYNNHPMDGVYEKLRELKFGDYAIPFPVIRLGNTAYVSTALDDIKAMFERSKKVNVYEDFLIRNRKLKEENVKSLTRLLELYEERIDLIERREIINKLLEEGIPFKYSIDIESDQLNKIRERIDEIGFITNESAIKLLESDYDVFIKYLNYTSIKNIQKLKEPKYDELHSIIAIEDQQERVVSFNRYLSNHDNLKNFIRVFPIVVTTNISAYHLGDPTPSFDLTVIDEASQCAIATALVPIIRGSNLLLVGDPQQLNPVITLDPQLNKTLMRKHQVSMEYNYVENSIYKTFLAVDPISDEILLRYHYRCHPKIIGFNNKKYYNNMLEIISENKEEKPLQLFHSPGKNEEGKNASLSEAIAIRDYIKVNPNERIGVITPFVKQKELVNEVLKDSGIDDIICGTVHAFQGDEKDVILFSAALTDTTQNKTYDWLKNNKELINVATSRAKNKLIMYVNEDELSRLNSTGEPNDFYELVEYVKENGESSITSKVPSSRALGIKPFSSELETAFMDNLKHALEITNEKCHLRKEVPISSVFRKDHSTNHLFFTGRFDFVVFKKTFSGKELPLFAVELDGPEHRTLEEVIERDKKKNEICKKNNFKLIRVENVYARRYNEIKQILVDHFSSDV